MMNNNTISSDSEIQHLVNLMIANGMCVVFMGLLAGLMLLFSMLEAVTLWPLPAWEVEVPGSTRGWVGAHSGGIMNGILVAGSSWLLIQSNVKGARAKWVAWGLIITGWANTVFYWAGNLSSNRGISVGDTPFGEGDIFGAIAYLTGGTGMIFTFVAVSILALGAIEQVRKGPQSG